MGLPIPQFFRYFTKNLAIATFLISFSVFNYGMDQTAYSTIQAMDPFINRFGTFNGKKMVITPKNLSILNSIPRITFALGVIMGGVIGERFGRRIVVALMLVICLVGVIISYVAQNFAQVLVGRMLVQMYIGMEGWLVPMFQAEIIPAPIRGSVVNSYVFNHIFGSFIMSAVTFKTSNFDSDMCWKIPIACLFIIPCFVLLLIWKIPESPRWLVRKGRDDEALKWLKYIYGENPAYAPEAELRLLQEALIQEADQGKWSDMIRGANLRRTMLQIVVQALNQLTGQAFASQYGTVFIKSLNTINPYTFTVLSSGLGCIGPIGTLLFIDRLGRRNMYLIFGTLACAALLTMGGLGLGNGSQSLTAGIVSMTIIYPLFYIMSFGGMTPVMGAELPSLRLRDKSAMVGWSVQNLSAFVVTFTIPYLLEEPYAALHSKVGFIFGGICALGLVWAFFCFPELKGRSLEEIDEMFEQKVPARKFKTWVSTNPDSIGTKVTNMEANAVHVNGKVEEEAFSKVTAHAHKAHDRVV